MRGPVRHDKTSAGCKCDATREAPRVTVPPLPRLILDLDEDRFRGRGAVAVPRGDLNGLHPVLDLHVHLCVLDALGRELIQNLGADLLLGFATHFDVEDLPAEALRPRLAQGAGERRGFDIGDLPLVDLPLQRRRDGFARQPSLDNPRRSGSTSLE